MSSKNSEPASDSPSAAVLSPCRRRCCLNDADICLGCGRSLAEILEWGNADQARRQAILLAAGERLGKG